MLKMVVLVRRKPGLSRAEFSRYWRETHAPLVKSTPELTRHMRRYVQNHMLDAGFEHASTAMGGLAMPAAPMDYDGIVEVWYDSLADLQASTASQHYLDVIRPDEMRLIDAESCVMYLVDENVVFDEANRPTAEAWK